MLRDEEDRKKKNIQETDRMMKAIKTDMRTNLMCVCVRVFMRLCVGLYSEKGYIKRRKRNHIFSLTESISKYCWLLVLT